MKVAITGATGFTGQRVVAQLMLRGHEVAALVRPPAQRLGVLCGGVRIVEGDLMDDSRLDLLLDGADALVHVASLGFGGAEPVVSAADARRIPRTVFFSSTSLFTRLPARSKQERIRAEARIRTSVSAWTILRPTMIYGDHGDRNLSRLIQFLSRTPLVPLPGGGRGLIQPIHVEDLGRAAVDALECDRARQREYNLSGAEASPLREIVDELLRLLKRRVPVVSLPIGPLALAAGLWHTFGLPPRVSAEQVRRLSEDKAFTHENAMRDWGFSPRGWREGLGQEVQLLRDTGRIK